MKVHELIQKLSEIPNQEANVETCSQFTCSTGLFQEYIRVNGIMILINEYEMEDFEVEEGDLI